MVWKVDFTPQAQHWFDGLAQTDRDRVAGRIDRLRARGPALGKSSVKPIVTSRHRDMKELRVPNTGLRALFAFGPGDRAIILVGGDKSPMGNRWYDSQVRIADRMLDLHQRTFERGSAWRATRAGTRSAARQI